MWEPGLAGYYCNFRKWSRALPSTLEHTDTVLSVLVCLFVRHFFESPPATDCLCLSFLVNMHVSSSSSKNTNKHTPREMPTISLGNTNLTCSTKTNLGSWTQDEFISKVYKRKCVLRGWRCERRTKETYPRTPFAWQAWFPWRSWQSLERETFQSVLNTDIYHTDQLCPAVSHAKTFRTLRHLSVFPQTGCTVAAG